MVQHIFYTLFLNKLWIMLASPHLEYMSRNLIPMKKPYSNELIIAYTWINSPYSISNKMYANFNTNHDD